MDNQDTQRFNEAVDYFVGYVNAQCNKHLVDNFPRLATVEHIEVTVKNPLAPVYLCLMKADVRNEGGATSRSYYGFIRRSDGAILYASGPKPFIGKSEATTVRGSIYDPSTWERCVGPYGIRTVRG